MFIKKKCPRCERKISKDYDFCPYCSHDFRYEKSRNNERDFGLLGKEDSITSMPNFGGAMPFNLNEIFNSKMFNNLFQEFDKQFCEFDKNPAKKSKQNNNMKKSGISISISMADGKNPDIKISGMGPDFNNLKQEVKKEKKIPKSELTDEQARKIAKLPKKEAKTEVRRLSNKIVYEIYLPGIKNLKDVLISKLENSIEIKAFSKENAYFKMIPINLPIINYKLEDEKLILELGTR